MMAVPSLFSKLAAAKATLPALVRASASAASRGLHSQSPLLNALPSDKLDPEREAKVSPSWQCSPPWITNRTRRQIRHFRYSSQEHPLYENVDKDGKPGKRGMTSTSTLT